MSKPETNSNIIAISLDDSEYELLNKYLSYCNDELGLNVDVKDFLIDNACYWTNEALAIAPENDLNNALSDEFKAKLRAIEKDMRDKKPLPTTITFDTEHLRMLNQLKELTELGLGKEVSLEWVIHNSIRYSYKQIIGS